MDLPNIKETIRPTAVAGGVKNQVGAFMTFVRTQGVVGLAIGIILGGAVTTVVKALIDDIVNPIVGLVLNQAKNLSDMSATVMGATIKYGDFINVLINFLVIAAVVYYGVKLLKLDKIDKPKA
jgi:large conductance mechanosensitive channel protein